MHERILVIEDDDAVAANLIDVLEEAGYSVKRTATGEEGLDSARESVPHLVVLDVRLPGMNGFDVLRQMRSLGLRMPVLMLTANADEVDKVLGLELGADDYLTKPYRVRELLARVRAQLRRAWGELSAAEGETTIIGDIVIEYARGRALRDGRDLNLTPTEFRMLAFLARSPGQAFSRRQLLDNVWGYSAEGDEEKTVTVHIRRLREKVEQDSSNPIIVLTVPGIGYRVAG